MPITQAQLVAQIRDRLDEESARQWTDPNIRRWINEGARDIARKGECLQTRQDIPVTTGTREYLMPTDIIRVNRVEWRPTSQTQVYPLEYRDFVNMDAVWWSAQEITQNTPRMYTMWGYPPTLKLILYPTPSEPGSLKTFYYRLPVDRAVDGTEQTSAIDIPEGWGDLLLDFAEYSALRKDADPRWQEAKALYLEHLNDFILTTRRWSDQSGGPINEYGATGGGLPDWLVAGDW